MVGEPMRLISCLWLVFVACKGGEGDCTAEAVGSVNVVLSDTLGAPITGATLRYGVDGGAAETACEEMTNGNYVCGWEVAGDFVIEIEKAGYLSATATATVADGECHVVPETVQLSLQSDVIDCPAVETYAVSLTVTDGQGADVTSGTVTWAYDLDGATPEACDHSGGNTWMCGAGVVGGLVLSITEAGPYEPWSQVVTVLGGECGPITQDVEAVLQYLPD